MMPLSKDELPSDLAMSAFDEYGLAMQENQHNLIESINQSIGELKESSVLQDIFSKYQGSSLPHPIQLQW